MRKMKRGLLYIVSLSISLFLFSFVCYGTSWIPYDSNNKPVLDKNIKNNTSIRYWKDIKTSLLWTNVNSKTVITKNWKEATSYCFHLNYSGKDSWRLPSIDEFKKAYENGIFNLNNLSGIGKLDSGLFWSLSSTSLYTYYAWVIDFSTGKVSPYIKIADLGVLCVKD